MNRKSDVGVWSAAALNIAANFYLISRYSYIGAAATTAATELVVSSCMLFIIYRTTRHLPRIGALVKACGAAAVMVAALIVSPSQSFFFLIALERLCTRGCCTRSEVSHKKTCAY